MGEQLGVHRPERRLAAGRRRGLGRQGRRQGVGMHLEQGKVAEHQPDPALRGRHQLAQDRRGTGAVGALVVAVLDDGDRCAPLPEDVSLRLRALPALLSAMRSVTRPPRSGSGDPRYRQRCLSRAGCPARAPPHVASAPRAPRSGGGVGGGAMVVGRCAIGRRVTMGESADQGRNGGPVRTDPTFYRSAAEAVAAPTEKLAYVVAFDRAGPAARRADGGRRRRGVGRATRRWSAGRTCRPAATSCTTSAGTPARAP